MTRTSRQWLRGFGFAVAVLMGTIWIRLGVMWWNSTLVGLTTLSFLCFVLGAACATAAWYIGKALVDG